MRFFKNCLIKAVLWPFLLFQKKGKNDHFLIVSTTGLGDTLWATPALRALRKAAPMAYIVCLTSSVGAAVLDKSPYLDEIRVLKKPYLMSWLKHFFYLRKKQIGTALVFHASQRAALPFTVAIGAQRRVGTDKQHKGLESLLTDCLPVEHEHEIERRIKMIKALFPLSEVSFELEFTVPEIACEKASSLLPNQTIVGFHLGAKDSFKQWPIEYFVKVAKALKERTQCHIVVSGTPAEEKLLLTFKKDMPEAQVLIEPLDVMAAALKKMSLFITNDTGPMHLAFAVKTPTIAIFTPTSHQLCGPYKNNSASVLQGKPTCSPCLWKKCKDPFCLRQISPEEVILMALQKLKGSFL
jgi:ADP-heptose:LPS heptosyltransferase